MLQIYIKTQHTIFQDEIASIDNQNDLPASSSTIEFDYFFCVQTNNQKN